MKTFKPYRIGIIDIGSNTMRFVVYEIGENKDEDVRIILNDKEVCSLGRDLATTGKLYLPGISRARKAIKRFVQQIEDLELEHLKVIATAAVRDAIDGPDFIDQIEERFGLSIEVLEGEQEAAYSAYGVYSSYPSANGIVADIGGGSVEISTLVNGKVDDCMTLPIGVLRLKSMEDDAESVVREMITAVPEQLRLHTNLYAVGGSWRAYAETHQLAQGQKKARSGGYKMSYQDVISHTDFLQNTSPKDIHKKYKVGEPRNELLPYAAIVLKNLCDILIIEDVLFSNAGLRDGILYSLLHNTKI